MREWKTPVMQELSVELTASAVDPGTSEAAGYNSGNGWVWPTYDSSIYEKGPSGNCVVKKKASQNS